jgi:hypothetical protein
MLREGEMTLDEVLDEQFVADFIAATGCCQCARDIIQNIDRVHDEMRRQKVGAWAPPPRKREPEPARSTIDAYEYLLRTEPEKAKAWLDARPDLAAWLKRNKHKNGGKR